MLNLLPLLLAKAGAATITTKVVVAGAVSAAALGTAGATGALPVEELLPTESTSVVVSDETSVEDPLVGDDLGEGAIDEVEAEDGVEDGVEGETAQGLDRATEVASAQAQAALEAARQAAELRAQEARAAAELRAQEAQEAAADARGAGAATSERAPQAPAQQTERTDAPAPADAGNRPEVATGDSAGRGRN